MGWPIGSLKKKSFVKKSKWSLHPKNFPATKKTKLLSIPSQKALSKLLPASDRSISCQILFFPPRNFAVSSDLRAVGCRVESTPRASELMCGLLVRSQSRSATDSAVPRTLRTTATPAGGNAMMLHPAAKNTQIRWGVTSQRQILFFHICPTSAVTSYFSGCIFSTHFLSREMHLSPNLVILNFSDIGYWKCQVMILPILKINIKINKLLIKEILYYLENALSQS